MLDFTAQYAAFQRRDPAFDGVVFVAVKTTGVYCRPVCPARTPFARNIRFYPSAAAAERAGFRPCLRCRPETAFLQLYGRPPSALRQARTPRRRTDQHGRMYA
jgi:AraC family transcriptional regulator of adaptative response / DNA-3-methyladenine glycosylase II